MYANSKYKEYIKIHFTPLYISWGYINQLFIIQVANGLPLFSSLLMQPLKFLYMDKQITNLNSTYTTWIVYLIAEICECEKSKITPSEIAINEEEVKEYYNNGLTPSIVFNHIWQQDAGYFYAM